MTIYALSSGPGISGISVIRVSGIETKKIITKLTNGAFPRPREATLKKINKINTNELIDEGIVIWFPGLRATQVKIWQNFMYMAVDQ